MSQILRGGKMNLTTIDNTISERIFVHELFQDAETRKYYVLRDDHRQNIDSFVEFMAHQNRTQSGLSCIIRLQDQTPVGLITAEVCNHKMLGIHVNVGYIIAPEYRRKGYAKEALMIYVSFFQNNRIPLMSLDISGLNFASQKVAQCCGFKEINQLANFDSKHPEIGMRTYWIRTLNQTSNRDILCNKAMMCFQNDEYAESVRLFEQALKERFEDGSVFSDGQIYSNMGIALSWANRYQDAYESLMKAVDLGIFNNSVQKELAYLINERQVKQR